MKHQLPNHIAFIMDGNGRWAKARNKPRFHGHRKGAKNILKICKKLYNLQVKNVSLFAFSWDNHARPEAEVNFLMNQIVENFKDEFIDNLIKHSVKFKWIGFKENLNSKIIEIFQKIEQKTKDCDKMTVFLYFNYSFSKELENFEKNGVMITAKIEPIDLLIRTSGEQRISNFCMNLILYSELIFEEKFWPEYTVSVLLENLRNYAKRERRFGNVKNI